MILTVVLIGTLAAIAGWVVPPHFTSATVAADGRKISYYVCPMHPAIKYDKPGDCPICGMKLQPVYADATGTNAVNTATPADSCCGVSCPMKNP